MNIHFTKMQGAGNDFVVLDETRGRLGLSPAQYRFLGDRHFGVGADQILLVRPAPSPEFDFSYAIVNNDGSEVEHCGNGARCFVRYVRSKGLTTSSSIRVKTVNRALTLTEQSDGRVTVDMGSPVFDVAQLAFAPQHASAQAHGAWQMWRLSDGPGTANGPSAAGRPPSGPVALVSMGNPHAVQLVESVDSAPVGELGAWMQSHPAFPNRVNAGFMQVLGPGAVRLRVFERGAGETLACGTGACAAVVAGIRLGLLDDRVDVQTQGGTLTIEWPSATQGLGAPVCLTGPAVTVFEGQISLPD